MSSTAAPFDPNDPIWQAANAAGQAKGQQQAATDPYAFDSAFYTQSNPDVKASGMDPLQHYIQFGMKEGRPRNYAEAYGQLTKGQGQSAPTDAQVQATMPTLDPTNPASWAAFKTQAHNQTAGLNRMPNVAPTTDTLAADPLAVLAQFYRRGNNYSKDAAVPQVATAAQSIGQAGVQNLGMGQYPDFLRNGGG